jgi:AcrR family transcriptional regulator
MDSVARRARLSRALVYVYFKDKQDLHFAIAARALEMLRQRFTEATARARTGMDKVEACGRAYMAYAQEFPLFFDACARLESHEPGGTEPSPQALPCIECGKRVHDVVVEALATGQRDGTIRQDIGDLEVVSRVLWGFIHGLIQIAIKKGEPLAQAGISVQQLGQQALGLIRVGLTCGLKG